MFQESLYCRFIERIYMTVLINYAQYGQNCIYAVAEGNYIYSSESLQMWFLSIKSPPLFVFLSLSHSLTYTLNNLGQP